MLVPVLYSIEIEAEYCFIEKPVCSFNVCGWKCCVLNMHFDCNIDDFSGKMCLG